MYTNIHGPWTICSNNSGDPLTFHSTTMRLTFLSLIKMSLKLLDGHDLHILQNRMSSNNTGDHLFPEPASVVLSV